MWRGCTYACKHTGASHRCPCRRCGRCATRSSAVGLSFACVHIQIEVSCASNNPNQNAANVCGSVSNAYTWHDTHTSPQSLWESISSGAGSGLRISSNFTCGRLRLALRTTLPPIAAASKIPGVVGAATGPGAWLPLRGLSSSDTAARGVSGHTSIAIGDDGEYPGDVGSPVVGRGVAGVAWIAMYWFVPTTRNEHVQLRMCMYEHMCGHAMHSNNYSICT